MTNLELSQKIGLTENIISQIFNDGIRNYEVLGINADAKRFPIQYRAAESVGKVYAMSVKSFLECKLGLISK